MELKCKQCAHELPTAIMCDRCFERNSYTDSFVAKSNLRKLVEEMRSYSAGLGFRTKSDVWADKLEALLGGE